MNEAILIPNKSIGPILIGDAIANYPDRQLDDEYELDDEKFQSYSFENTPVSAVVDGEGNIESLNCDEECIWKGVNLIGLGFDKFLEISGTIPDGAEQVVIETDEGEQTQDVYEFDDLGLLVWVFENTVVTVMAAVYEERDEDEEELEDEE